MKPDLSFERAVGLQGSSTGALERVTRGFQVGEQGAPFRLAQGSVLQVDLRRFCLQYNAALVRKIVDVGMNQLWNAEDLGFLLNMEKEDLSRAMNLLSLSSEQAGRQLYDEAFADLRHAYMVASATTMGLQDLLESASRSALILTFFFSLTSVGLVQLLVEGESYLALSALEKHKARIPLRPLYIGAIYAALLAAFYVAFPGCRLIGTWEFAGAAVFSFLLGLVLLRMPKLLDKATIERRSIAFGSAFVAAFSIAYRHLRRRRLRTVLTLATVVTLMFSFITLTSVYAGTGLVVQDLGRSKVSVDALFIRDVNGSFFNPLSEGFTKWLKGQPNVTAVAPKAESSPGYYPLFYVRGSTRYEGYGIRGVLGFIPDLEAAITRINKTIIKGRYLTNDERNGVLISRNLARKLEVDIGDQLDVMGRLDTFTVTGLFDEKALEDLRDVDGSTLLPLVQSGPFSVEPCPSDALLITTYKTALTFPNVATSRLDVLMRNGDSLPRLSELVTLTYEYMTWVSVGGRTRWAYVGAFMEEKGLGLTFFLTVFMALVIGNTMLGAAAERRNELATLSSVGLNPGHISALFLAEAMVIGFVGGGLGYLVGISAYRPLSAAVGGLIVREKVSAEWSLIALMVSVLATVLAGVIPAVRASTIVTPSLLRRWRPEESLVGLPRPVDVLKPWSLDLPVKIRAKEASLFFAYVEKELRQYTEVRITGYETDYPEELGPPSAKAWTRRLTFTHLEHQSYRVSRNELVVTATPGEEYCRTTLDTFGEDQMLVQAAGSFVRKLMFEWNAAVFKVVTTIDSMSQVYTVVDAYSPKLLYVVDTRPDTAQRVRALQERWLFDGTRVPKTILVPMDPDKLQECMKKADELVSDANIICVTGGPGSVCVALALMALKHDRMMCYADDPRPRGEREAEPFYALRISKIELPFRE